MKPLTILCLVLASTVVVKGQTITREERTAQSAAVTNNHVSPGPKTTPEAVVTEVWSMATWGDLLRPDGRNKVGGWFVKPPAYGKNLQVVCNEWGVSIESITDSTARIAIRYCPAGQIDPLLRYIPPQKTTFMEFGIVYTMKLTQKYFSELNSDGSVKRKVPAWKVWAIEGPEAPSFPFTTVNTAIRYVLEKRAETKDPVIRKNADDTLAQLLKLH